MNAVHNRVGLENVGVTTMAITTDGLVHFGRREMLGRAVSDV